MQSLYVEQLGAVPELQSYGSVLKSSARPIALTESEMEYVVTAVKHIYKEHIVFQVRLASLLVFESFADLSGNSCSSTSRIPCKSLFWKEYLFS